MNNQNEGPVRKDLLGEVIAVGQWWSAFPLTNFKNRGNCRYLPFFPLLFSCINLWSSRLQLNQLLHPPLTPNLQSQVGPKVELMCLCLEKKSVGKTRYSGKADNPAENVVFIQGGQLLVC